MLDLHRQRQDARKQIRDAVGHSSDWAALQSPVAGDIISIKSTFESITDAGELLLPRGLVGIVRKVDLDGDVEAFFPELSSALEPSQWLDAGDFASVLLLQPEPNNSAKVNSGIVTG